MPESPSRTESRGSRAQRALSIFVVTGDRALRASLVRSIERHGHRVTAPVDPATSLEHLGREGAHLVLVDLALPDLGAFELAAAIRDRERVPGTGRIPIVALADSDAEGRRERDASGFDGYVRKPLDDGELRITLDLLANDREPDRTPAPLDRSRMLEHIGTDPQLLVHVVRLFEQDTPPLLDQIREAETRGDAAAVERAAHRLKGSLAMLGADAAATIAANLERLGASRVLVGSGALVRELEAELARLMPELARVVEDLARR